MTKNINLSHLTSTEKDLMLDFLVEQFRGKFFGAKADTRTKQDLRYFKGVRTDVREHLQGGEPRYNPAAYGLIPVWESDLARKVGGKNAYRNIAKEGVRVLNIGGMHINF